MTGGSYYLNNLRETKIIVTLITRRIYVRSLDVRPNRINKAVQ